MNVKKWFILSVGIALFPVSAHAGFFVEGSAGYAIEVSPEIGGTHEPNVMLAGGWSFMDWIRVELGLVAGLEKTKALDASTQVQIRPMLVLAPPLVPIYLRGVMAVKNAFSETRELAYGACLGLGFSLFGVGAFVEGGALPATVDSELHWLIEGRAGLSYSF